MKATIQKIEETRGNPNGIHIGYKKTGIISIAPEVGRGFVMDGNRIFSWFATSEITDILERDEQDRVTKFKTKNSTYKLTYDERGIHTGTDSLTEETGD